MPLDMHISFQVDKGTLILDLDSWLLNAKPDESYSIWDPCEDSLASFKWF